MACPLPLNLHLKTTRLVLALLLLAALLARLGVPVAWAEGITVTRGDDATGAGDGCTLREAITNANNDDQSGSTDCPAGNGADAITFAGNYTITLGSALPALAGPLTVDGAGQSIAVSGNDAVRVFVIQAGAVVTISHLRLISGTGGADFGGGIYNSGTLAVLNSTLSGNSATFGGGIHNGGTLTVFGSTLSGNRAPGGFGGGIYNFYNSGALTVTNSILSNNLASYGGGIHNEGTLTVLGSTLSGNAAGLGGSIYNSRTLSGAMLRVTNSTFSGNSAGVGGSIYNDNTLRVTNSTFSGNSANAGGGIYNFNGTLHLHNSLIANSPAGGDCQNQGTIATNVNNLIEDGSCSPTLSGDPNLGPLQDNGGVPTSTGLPPFTHALLPGSPALDAAGDCTSLLDPDQNQRGVARPLDGDGNGSATCDIGAFEASPPPDLEVRGSGLLIASGDTGPSLSDGTDFGTVTAGGGVTRTFVISNSGSGPLNLTGSPLVSFTGPAAGDFSLVISPTTPVASNSITPFQVRFAPLLTGTRMATLILTNNDPDENPYTFALQGSGSNLTPLADAGNDQNVHVSDPVTLTGSASSDPDGHTPLTYGWSQTGGSDVSLSDPTASQPTFTAPGASTVLTFSLTVTDSFGLADPTPAQVVVTVTNGPPIAMAGIDQSVDSGAVVTLDGSTSSDPDNDLPLTYGWSQTGGSDVSLSDPTISQPTFTAPGSSTVLTFSLTVTDSFGLADSTPDQIVVTVTALPPDIAILGNGQLIPDGDPTPSPDDHTDFGSLSLGGAITRTFIISNSGDDDLDLTSLPRVSFTGPAAGDFSLAISPTTPVVSNSITPFEVRFAPLLTGTRMATLTLANNDPNENPYTFALQGIGVASGRRIYVPLILK